MENRLTVTASPHIQDRSSTRGLMGSVVVALLPCVAASALIFGWRALLVVGITTAASVGFEYLYCLLMKKPIPVGDLSAVVTGIILGLNMPVGIPLWIAIIGAFIAIVIAKQLFGGIGFNFANPALVGRIVLFTGFAGSMTKWVYPTKAVLAFRKLGIDAAAGATPLQVADGSGASLLGKCPLTDLFLGVHGGVLGETCALAILLGFAWLVASRTISPSIPLTYVGSYAVFSLLYHLFADCGIAAGVAAMLVLHEVLDSLGHGVSRDQLLADLAWLAEQGLVACDCLKPGGNGCTVATLTPRGLDVALGRAVVPGVKRPLPGDPPDPEAL